MGEVYRATDTKLKRQVAIKILPVSFAADHDRLARFQREAEVLASLNHPNIAGIYGLEESGGVSALVMELVEGEDLSRRIARGAIPVDEALPYARQIAEALEAAHEQGIVHRDLKPANIKVRSDGTAKVLDFGLAKAMEPAAGSSPSVSQSPTVATPAATEAGMIMGTLAYMSPEQARGRPVDRRTDIWAFGCVLYEMLTGVPAFSRETVTDTLSAITRDEPDWDVHPDIPPPITRLLRRCLDKDPRTRLRDIGEARIALLGSNIVDSAAVRTNAGPSPRARSGVAPWAVALLLALAASAVTWWIAVRRPAADGQSLGPTITRVTADSGLTTSPAVATNGSLLAYASDRGGGSMNIWVQPLPDGQPVQITHGDEDATEPDFSPDGSRIAFRSERNGGGIYVVPALGGGERFVAPKGRRPGSRRMGSRSPTSQAGEARQPMCGLSMTAAHHRVVWRSGSSTFGTRLAPLWSPDGAFLAVAAIRASGVRLPSATGGSSTCRAVRRPRCRPSAAFEHAGLSSNTGPAAWMNGEILFSATTGDVSSLWSIALSSDGRTVTGLPRRLTAGVGTDGEPSVARGANDRTVYYANKDERANVYRLPLSGSPSAASLERVTDAAASDLWPSVSADGRTLVFASNRSSDWGAWSRDLASGRETPLTSTGGGMATVSPDGQRVSYSAAPQVAMEICDAAHRRRRDGAAAGRSHLCVVVAVTDRAVWQRSCRRHRGTASGRSVIGQSAPGAGGSEAGFLRTWPAVARWPLGERDGMVERGPGAHHRFPVPRRARAAGRLGRAHGGSVGRRRACVVAAGRRHLLCVGARRQPVRVDAETRSRDQAPRWPRDARAASSRSATVDDFDGATSSAHRARAE